MNRPQSLRYPKLVVADDLLGRSGIEHRAARGALDDRIDRVHVDRLAGAPGQKPCAAAWSSIAWRTTSSGALPLFKATSRASCSVSRGRLSIWEAPFLISSGEYLRSGKQNKNRFRESPSL